MRTTARAAAMLLVVAATTVGLAGPAFATAQCNHRVHFHSHNGHNDRWQWLQHQATGPGTWVELFINTTHNTYDVANCSVHT